MKFLFVTLFPEQIEQAAGHSIIKRGLDAGLLELECTLISSKWSPVVGSSRI